MPKCAAIGCENINDKDRVTSRQLELEKNVHLTFHSFPKNPCRRKAWVNAMQLGDWQPRSGSYLCSLHFDENSFDRTSSLKTRLKDNALPRIIRSSKRKYPDVSTEDFKDTSIAFCITNEEQRQKLSIDRCTSVSPERCTEPLEKRQTVDRATSVSPSRIFNSPSKERIRASNELAIAYYKKKVKSVQDKLRNKEKKIARMQKILQTLQEKNLLTDNKFDILQFRRGFLHAEMKLHETCQKYAWGHEINCK